jgi:hypothetical protein
MLKNAYIYKAGMVEPSYVIATCVHALGATVVPQVTEPMNNWYLDPARFSPKAFHSHLLNTGEKQVSSFTGRG